MKIANQEEHNNALQRVAEVKKQISEFKTNSGDLETEVTLLEEEKKETIQLLEEEKKVKIQAIDDKIKTVKDRLKTAKEEQKKNLKSLESELKDLQSALGEFVVDQVAV
ncbi:hypothetical protein [Leptospira noguchii]|uniref:Uncharacterized protein n=1 Tax=Leptospira noguchii serovar Panama str. CZ214 TaxID=1001595 RepID=T0FG73_9LEPT|nr:hypothetical protein [Leptospira noguchii]EQA69957.1 hypothetical protein LEP1GSC059_2333 [Leptospira noguchii serovar Panama str. CZ214]EQA70429.1 hypothetical protein LEP1GSC059_0729 [Leptospira noguchii serovar Panama str. CZ214]EQA72283.1 hypothetical protein LEP1GSC059_3694 [Leptospira noguchii serovar Panama str. CZ214]EQA72524.1 hypothetical protein LEP1GSC059_3224 [Leptospira noguchii serovar Panama str. CZ214]UOG61461.1 hypothetical protein MAL07_05425 [Leptospira noguchii]